MNINELREAFAVWPLPITSAVEDSFNILRLLRDPTPITEAGLRELGFEGSEKTEFYVGTLRGWLDEVDGFYFYNCSQYPKSMGKLRRLLLGVGEA